MIQITTIFKNHYLVLLPALFLFISCDKEKAQFEEIMESKDIEVLTEYKDGLESEMVELQSKITRLNDSIISINPNFKTALVKTYTVSAQTFEENIELQGNVETKKDINVYPEASGSVKRVLVTEGQYVRAGQTLARINADVLRQNILQLQTQSELANVAFEKQKRLWDQKIGSEMQYLQARSNKRSLDKQISALQSQLSNSTVRAPFSGVINQVIVKNGEFASPGMPLFRLVSLSDLYVKTDVPEKYLERVKEGNDVQVEFPSINKTIDSKVKIVSQTINPANRSFYIHVPVRGDGSIKPNLVAKMTITDLSIPNAITVPVDAIEVNGNEESYVYIAIKKGDVITAKRQQVEIEKNNGTDALISQGIKEGDVIITDRPSRLEEGQHIQISN